MARFHIDTPPERFLPRDYDWKGAFLRELVRTGIVAKALQAAGVGRTHVYAERERDAEFKQAWDEVRELQVETLEQIAVKRAGAGSDALIKFLLESWRPETYRPNLRVEHTGSIDHNHRVSLLNGEQPVNIDSQARREAARLLQQEAIADAEVVEDEAA